jgi:hypothetical protein
MPQQLSGRRRFPRFVCLFAAIISLVVAAWAPLAAQTGDAQNRGPWTLAVPARRAADAPPAGPPPVPNGADRLGPLTIETVVRRQPSSGTSQTIRQTVSRTADSIHVAATNREWLFERNPRDPRRVSASLIEHASKTIVLYTESDLRMALGIQGWTHVLALGFDPQALETYQLTNDTRTIDGIRFARYVSQPGNGPRPDLWWNEAQLLPTHLTTSDTSGETRFAIERVHAGANAVLFTPPETRFPGYRVMALADWLERH